MVFFSMCVVFVSYQETLAICVHWALCERSIDVHMYHRCLCCFFSKACFWLDRGVPSPLSWPTVLLLLTVLPFNSLRKALALVLYAFDLSVTYGGCLASLIHIKSPVWSNHPPYWIVFVAQYLVDHVSIIQIHIEESEGELVCPSMTLAK